MNLSLATFFNTLSRKHKIVLAYLLAVITLIVVYTLLYNLGMLLLENQSHSISRSFQTVIETMTTTGYGADSPWETRTMNLFVVFMQLTGIAIAFVTLRLIIIPLFADADINLDARLSNKHNHVIICGYRQDTETLLNELEQINHDYVLISTSKPEAKTLSENGYEVIHGNPETHETLQRASINTASAIITDTHDANVSTILNIRTLNDTINIIAVTDTLDNKRTLTKAGANTVLSPHSVLGHRLGEKAATSFSKSLPDAITLGDDIEVTELPIHRNSPLDGVTIQNSNIREQTGVQIIAAWIDGELHLPPNPTDTLKENSVLLVTGSHSNLEQFTTLTDTTTHFQEHDSVIIAGYGETGKAAEQALKNQTPEITTIDTTDTNNPDILGDITSETTLNQANITSASALLITVPDDTTTLLTTVLAKSLNPDIDILTRINSPENAVKAHKAGASYVLTMPQVSARMLAQTLLGEDVLTPTTQIRFARISAHPLKNTTLKDTTIFDNTNCRVLAIETNNTTTTDIDPTYTFDADDHLTIVGTDTSIQKFLNKHNLNN